MKKNSECVGVDEKFILEDEKYVKDSVLGNNEQIFGIIGNVVEQVNGETQNTEDT